MDTKQAQINVFTEGLNTDLHPLTTPNNILTDCINGTVITYNGNEFILQNDMGNYKLEKAKLPSDYIPVGVKEYGGIIYIVSYNPIDKLCQIGSYPSPQTLFDNTDNVEGQHYYGIDTSINDYSTFIGKIQDIISNKNISIKEDYYYTELSRKQTLTILQSVPNIQNTYLNPGDKYWLQKVEEKIEGNKESDVWKFQVMKYYSLNNDKKLYDITDDVKDTTLEFQDSDVMNSVTWTCPGWICAKPELFNINYFNLYVTKLSYPRIYSDENTLSNKLKFSIDTQTQIYSSNIDKTTINNYKNKIKYKCIYDNDSEDGDWTDIIISNKTSSVYGESSIIEINTNEVEINLSEPLNPIGNNKDTKSKKVNQIKICAVPYITSDIENNNGYGYIFNQFRVEYTIDLDKLINAKDINIFDTYKYIVNDSGVNVNFNINLPIDNINQEESVKLKIYPLVNNNGKLTKGDTHLKCYEHINLLGQNLINISFDQEGFLKNNIYILSIELTKDYSRDQILITSELMNQFYNTDNRYQLITPDRWLRNLPSLFNLGESKVNIGNSSSKIDNGYFFEDNVENIFKTDIDLEEDYTQLLNNKGIDDISTTSNNPPKKYSGYLKTAVWEGALDCPELKCEDSKSNDLWSNVKFSTSLDNKKIIYTYNEDQTEEVQANILNKKIDIKDVVSKGFTIGWYGKIPVTTADRQYLFESMPWTFKYNSIKPDDDYEGNDNVGLIPKDPTNSKNPLPGWKYLINYSIWNSVYSQVNTLPIGFVLSKGSTDFHYALKVERFKHEHSSYDNTLLCPRPESNVLYERIGNKDYPTYQFTYNTDGNNRDWTYDPQKDPSTDSWVEVMTVLDVELSLRCLFVPILFTVHNADSNIGRGWSLPGGNRINPDSTWVSCGIGILYYSENKRKYGIALLKIMPDDPQWEGKAHNIYAEQATDDWVSAWLTTNTIGKNWYNNNIVASMLLGLGLHIYSLRNIQTIQMFILNNDLTEFNIEIKDAKVVYDRTDILSKWYYKEVNLLQNDSISLELKENDLLQYSNRNFENIEELPNKMKPIVNNSVNAKLVTDNGSPFKGWFKLNDIKDVSVDSLVLSSFITNNKNKLLSLSVDNNSSTLFVDLNENNSFYRVATALAKILKVKDATSTNNTGSNIIVYNGDFTADDVKGGVCPDIKATDIPGNSILPYVSLLERDRLPLSTNWTETIDEELMPVTEEFKNTYKKVNIE